MDRVLPEDVDELGISLVSHFTRSDTHTDWRAQGVCGADRSNNNYSCIPGLGGRTVAKYVGSEVEFAAIEEVEVIL